jgi:colanic acid/amylovoran biosynthesis glycosyltransferase
MLKLRRGLPVLDWRPDALVAHFGTTAVEFLFLKTLRPDLPLITCFHGYDFTGFYRRNPGVYDRLKVTGDVFLAQSQSSLDRLRGLDFAADKLELCRLGLDPERFPFRERSAPETGPVRVLTVSRLVPIKGLEYAVRGVARALRAGADLEYQIVGEGPERPALESLIAREGVAGRVRLLGARERSAVIELLGQAHVFMLTSVTTPEGDVEGQGLVLLEAGLCGLPVVATRHNGFPEALIDGQSGFLVPERDPDAIADRLVYLSSHTDTWAELGRRGRQHVRQDYDLADRGRRLVDLISSLREGRGP